MYAPIILFVYNRIDLFLKVYDALRQCSDVEKSDLFIFSDGPKNDDSKQDVENLREQLKKVSDDSSFHKTTIIESVVNKGLASSIIDGVSQVISEYGRAIVLEDDCIPSKYFIQYMNSALDYYDDDKTIGSIAGYAEVIDLPDDYAEDVYLARRSCSWGWGTWIDRWNAVDWNLDEVSKIFRNPRMIHRLNENGSDRLMRLYRQSKRNAQSWSIRFGACHILRNWYVICPRYSYIYNIGDDGSGIHTKSGEIGQQYDLSLAIEKPTYHSLVYDSRIQRLLKKHASDGVFSEIKRSLAAIVIVIKTNLESIFA